MTTPAVSVIVVTRNEAAYIRDCLESVCRQFEAGDAWELILVDGYSEDDTLSLAENVLSGNKVSYRIILNPKRVLASGWNLGIQHAAGEFVVRPDAHATLGPGYIKKAIGILGERPGVAAVGGRLRTRSKTPMGSIISEALSMRTGVGNSSFRTGGSAGYKDTVVYGVYRKNVFDRVGLFNEQLVRHQDTDMHKRIRDAGMRFYLEPSMSADYFCRESVGKLMRQMYQIGFGFADLLKTGSPGSLGWRHKMPFLFYGILVFLLIAGFLWPVAWMVVLFIYIGYLCIIIAEASGRWLSTGRGSVMMVAGIIPFMHMAYAWGTFKGYWRLLFKKV